MALRKSLTENIGVKLIALVVALFIWFNASGQQEVVWLKSVPITLEGIPDSLVVTGSVPGTVEISITGTKRQLLLMGLKRFNLVVDLSEAVAGRQRVSLSPRQIQLPSGIDRRNVIVIEPLALNLRLEPLVTKRVQVTLSTTGAIPDNLILMDGALSITPSWVSVKGPASVVQNIRSVTTEPLDLSKVKQSFERELPLAANMTGVESTPARVTVSANLSERSQRVLSNVPPTVLIDSEDHSATVTPSTVALTLIGPRAVLDTLSSGDVSVLLNLGGLTEARYRMAPEIILPPGVRLVSTSADTLIVEIVKNPRAGGP